IENGRSELGAASAGPQGTRITIRRRRGPARQERALLCELCAAVEAELTVQGQPVKKKPLLAENLVSMRLHSDDFSGPSRIAVPVRGDVCRTWLLDQGIPWQVTTAAPAQGFVFAAVLETAKPLTPILLETLSAASARLYHWLAENYIKFPEHLQSRIEDLFFRQAHAGGDPDLLSRCAPFRLWHSQRRLTLDEVRRKAENHELYAQDTDDLPAFFSDREKEVLRLTRTQKDFLVNFLHLPIILLDSRQELKARPQRIRATWHAVVRLARKRMRPAKFRIIAENCLSHEENRLCRELEIEWQRRSSRAMTKKPMAVAMIAGRGMVPARRLIGDANELLLVRRRHPLTLCALQRIGHDPRNIELAFSALMPDRLLTADE
ncbi:MAG TPA: hypothetical protein VLQ89_01795, partial [Candidatus Binatia bacterium]|nr:hypothetical protein [Candidatus Binatia bacterium]